MVDNDELKIISSFLDWMKKRPPARYLLLSKNGKQFDISFVLTRLVLQDNPSLKKGLFILEYEHFDLQEITDKRISLNDMAKLLACAPKSGTGKNAIKLWEEKRFEELKKYCTQDVELTEEIYLKWLGLQRKNGDGPEIWESEEIFHILM
jgi:predicted PolB exonuclease-like 3'-5' exonuclease